MKRELLSEIRGRAMISNQAIDLLHTTLHPMGRQGALVEQILASQARDRNRLLEEVDRLTAALEHLAEPDEAVYEYDSAQDLASSIALYCRGILNG